jgi:hypothetical protein
MHILFTTDLCLLIHQSRLVLLSSILLGQLGGLLSLNLLINLGSPAGLVSVRSSGIGGLLGSLGLLCLLLLLLDSGSVSEGVGNGSLVGLVESVVSVLGCVLVRLSGVGVT